MRSVIKKINLFDIVNGNTKLSIKKPWKFIGVEIFDSELLCAIDVWKYGIQFKDKDDPIVFLTWPEIHELVKKLKQE